MHESIEAPHAIQNSTRIYIRTGSVNQPCELAEIDRIEYLLQRRSKQQKLKEELRHDARSRIGRFLGALRISNPYLEINISPPFPYKPLITLDNLYNFCDSIQSGSPIYYYVNNPQHIINGICKLHGDQNEFSYREINHYGLIFIRGTIRKSTVMLGWLIGFLASTLGLAVSYYMDLPTGASVVCAFGVTLVILSAVKKILVLN